VTDAELVQAAIAASGLSARRFASEFGVNERTVRRWLSGESCVRDRYQRERLELIAAG
jgi:DNA-binding transcriptional regulator YiaG